MTLYISPLHVLQNPTFSESLNLDINKKLQKYLYKIKIYFMFKTFIQ